jgi:hypothetical protein
MWIDPQGDYIVVDYKATSKDSEVTLDADWCTSSEHLGQREQFAKVWFPG